MSRLRLPPLDPERDSLFEFRAVGRVPAAAVAAAVVALWVATVFLTYGEYREHGTVFGYAGGAFYLLFAPLLEELVFRGWILGQLRRRHSVVFGIVVSSLLFGLLHVRNIYWTPPADLARQMAYTGLVFGPVAAWVTLRCRSLWPAVVLHQLNHLWYYA